jgi:hypothetical protein
MLVLIWKKTLQLSENNAIKERDFLTLLKREHRLANNVLWSVVERSNAYE